MLSKIRAVTDPQGLWESCAASCVASHGCSSIASNRPSANLVLRRVPGVGGPDGHGGGHDGVGGGAEQLALVLHMPVDRPGPGGEALGQRPERQTALAGRVEQLDGSLDDALAGERLRAPL
jgi:hypothetical protein